MQPGRHHMEFLGARPWSELNPYEGEVDARFDGRLLTARAILPPGAWTDLRLLQDAGEVELRLGRGGTFEVAPAGAQAGLEQLEGAYYRAVGVVLEVLGSERIVIDAGFALLVDLDQPTGSRLSVTAGMVVRVDGMLELDCSPDDTTGPPHTP